MSHLESRDAGVTGVLGVIHLTFPNITIERFDGTW